MPTTDEDKMRNASEEKPHYYVSPSESVGGRDRGSAVFSIIVDEGWRQSVVCQGMYRWAAEWLVEQIQGKPYAPGRRP